MDAIGKLPFVAREGDYLNLWNVKSSGNWGADNQAGRELGESCVAYMREHENPALLFRIVDTIVSRAAPIGGVECGFFQRIAECASGTIANPPQQDSVELDRRHPQVSRGLAKTPATLSKRIA